MRETDTAYSLLSSQSFGQKVGLSTNTLSEYAFALYRAATPKQKEWPAPNLDVDACKITERVRRERNRKRCGAQKI